MTPLHHQIKSKLLPICLEINQAERSKEPKDKAKIKKGKELREKILKAASGNVFNENHRKYILEAISIALEMPELLESKDSYFPPLSILTPILGDDPKIGIIVLHGENKEYLSEDLSATFDKHVVLASDEVIENTLDNLTGEQLKYILRSSIFEPFLADMFEQTTELVAVEAEPETKEVSNASF